MELALNTLPIEFTLSRLPMLFTLKAEPMELAATNARKTFAPTIAKAPLTTQNP